MGQQRGHLHTGNCHQPWRNDTAREAYGSATGHLPGARWRLVWCLPRAGGNFKIHKKARTVLEEKHPSMVDLRVAMSLIYAFFHHQEEETVTLQFEEKSRGTTGFLVQQDPSSSQDGWIGRERQR